MSKDYQADGTARDFPDEEKIAMYLDWWRNFLTVQAFADHYGVSKNVALDIISEGKALFSMGERYQQVT